ncbi:hypothetical protein IQA49_13695 [Leptospira borgpetersenii serovar Ballum]|nr:MULTISPECIES: hypothetical protein [Leptospira]AXX15301.1 hypothetical protein C4Q31_06865 [Leptospira borgpetersenii serovar Ceylonica]MBE8161720.1 hypothetical protein [Leptospira borgpetersenii serovar Ballum]MBE8166163.1 hypothetical protein [Leptospira borgpetersenii serovar Ballum]MBE8171510.1 hypothetical protein [Leptospira borgpetersenii serovar Ballum]MBE8174659.1 hypothetical protein [Leptospira borgpetersenii serovar Ballum]
MYKKTNDRVSNAFFTDFVFLFTEYTSVEEWMRIQKGTFRNDRSLFQSRNFQNLGIREQV